MNLNLNQIPATITTVEELVAWGGLLLHRVNSQEKCLEQPNFADFVCQSSLFTADDATERLVIRMNFRLVPDYNNNGKKLWESVAEFVEMSIPTGFLTGTPTES
jgi:hypothetical protein